MKIVTLTHLKDINHPVKMPYDIFLGLTLDILENYIVEYD